MDAQSLDPNGCRWYYMFVSLVTLSMKQMFVDKNTFVQKNVCGRKNASALEWTTKKCVCA
jgi:hypothetical protein